MLNAFFRSLYDLVIHFSVVIVISVLLCVSVFFPLIRMEWPQDQVVPLTLNVVLFAITFFWVDIRLSMFYREMENDITRLIDNEDLIDELLQRENDNKSS